MESNFRIRGLILKSSQTLAQSPALKLTDEDRVGIAYAREDFATGRTVSSAAPHSPPTPWPGLTRPSRSRTDRPSFATPG